MLGSAFMAYIAFKLLPIIIGGPLGAGIVVLGLALAFYRVNNRPFITILQAWARYQIASKLYIWHKAPPKRGGVMPARTPVAPTGTTVGVPTLSDTHLKDMSWSLDVLDATKNQ